MSALLDVMRSVAVFSAIGLVAWLGMPPLQAALVCSLVQAASQAVVLWITWRKVSSLATAARQV